MYIYNIIMSTKNNKAAKEEQIPSRENEDQTQRMSEQQSQVSGERRCC